MLDAACGRTKSQGGLIRMILRRLGNKAKIAEKIYKTFPKHHVYLEPFFGTGSMYFLKPKAMHNIVNDLDDDVFNLWNVYAHKWKQLLEAIQSMPKSESLFNHWKKNKESDEVLKALRFLMLSNFAVFGSGSFIIECNNSKKVLLEKYIESIGLMNDTMFINKDFRIFYKNLKYTSFYEINNFTVMSYNDPPYLGTGNNYSNSFKEQDSIDLFNINCNIANKYPSKYYFAISEYKNEFIESLAKERNLNIIEIGEQRSINSRNTEILITNYETERSLFD